MERDENPMSYVSFYKKPGYARYLTYVGSFKQALAYHVEYNLKITTSSLGSRPLTARDAEHIHSEELQRKLKISSQNPNLKCLTRFTIFQISGFHRIYFLSAKVL